MAEAITLRSEAEAWDFLERLLDAPDEFASLLENIGDWPNFHLGLIGKKFHHSLTPPVMQAMLDFQAGLNRSLALINYGIENARVLRDWEKEQIEIVVSVGEGSSNVDIDGTEILKHFLAIAVNKMSSKEVIAIVTIVGVLWFGSAGVSHYIDRQAEIRGKQIEAEEHHDLISQIGKMSEEETKREKILASVIKKFPAAGIVKNEADKAFDGQAKPKRSQSKTAPYPVQRRPISLQPQDHLLRI